MRLRYGYVAVAALVSAQIAYFYGRLPDVIASHFRADGVANGHMSRDGFIGSYVGLVALLLLSFGAVSLLIRAIPTELINVPNKDYWFTGDREAASRAWLGRELQGFGLIVVLFVAAVMQRVFLVNVASERPCLPTPYVLACMGGLVLAIGALAFRMLRRFPTQTQ